MGSLGSASIQLNLDRSQFDSDLKKLQSQDAGQIAYRIKLDTKDFERQIKGLHSSQPIFIPLQIDTKTFDQQIKKLSTSIDPIIVDLAPNVKDFQEKLRRLSKITPVTVDIKVDETKVRQQFETIGKYAVEGFTQGFSGVEGAGKSAIDSMVKSVNKQLGIQSPSKVFREIGKYAVAGLMQGLDTINPSQIQGKIDGVVSQFDRIKNYDFGSGNIGDAIAKPFKSIESIILAPFKGIESVILAPFKGIESVILAPFKGIRSAILAPFDGIKSVIKSVFSGLGNISVGIDSAQVNEQFRGIGKSAAQGFAQGFAEAESSGESVINSLVSSVKRQLGIQSPSKVFRQIGEYAIAGLMQGLDSVDESKLKGVTNKIESYFKKSKIKINVDIDAKKSPLQQKTKVTLETDSVDGDISKAVEKGVRGASSKNIFTVLTGGLFKAAVGIGSGLLGVLLLPLKAATLAIGTIFTGAGLKLGDELSSGISAGIKSAIGSALSSSIGSSAIVGEAIGEGIVESLGLAFKKLMPGLMQEVSEQARQVLGEEKVFTADAVRRSRSSASASKDKQTATEQIQSDYERVVSQGKPARLKQLGAEIGGVLPGIQQDSQTFTADYASEQQRLQKIAERFKVKLTPERLIKKRVKEYEEQVKTFENLVAQLEAKGEIGKANKIRTALTAIPRPDTDSSKISKGELQFQEARYLGEIQGKFVSRELNKQFSDRRAELSQRKKAIAPQMQEYEQLSQELGGIGKASEVLGVSAPAKKSQKDNLPVAYQKIFQQVAALSGVGEIPAGMIPQLAASSKLRPGVYGSYTPENNRVNVPPEVHELIQKGQLNTQIIDTLVHELRHALQFGLGKVNPLAGETSAIPLATPTPQEARQFGKYIEGSTSAQPELAKPIARKLESDAYIFAARNTPQIAAKIQKESAVEQFQKTFGVAGANAEKSIKDLQTQTLKSIQPIQGLVEKYGANLRDEISQIFAQFDHLSKSLEPLLNKAAHIESLTSDEVGQLQAELGSALSGIVSQIESTPEQLKKLALAKVQQQQSAKNADSAQLPSGSELVSKTQQAQKLITANLKQSFKGKPSDRKVTNQELAGSTLTDIDQQIAFVSEQLKRTDLSAETRKKLGQFKGTIERQYRSYSPALRQAQKSQLPITAKNSEPVKQRSSELFAINDLVADNSGTELFAMSDNTDKILAALKSALLSVSPRIGKPKGKKLQTKLKSQNEARKELALLEAKIDEEVRKELEQLTGIEKSIVEPSLPSNAEVEAKVKAREQAVSNIRDNPKQFFKQRSKSAVIQKARYITKNAEGIANLVGTKVGESPNVQQTKALLNLQDAFGKVGDASAKFGQNQSDKNFKLLNGAVRELEGSLRKLGLPFELINHEIDNYTNKLKKMQAEGKIDVEVDVSSLAPEKFSFIDNILSKFSGLELKGLKAIGGLIQGFLAFQGIMYVQNILTDISVNAFKAFVELDRLKTALNFASGGDAGGAQNLAFVGKTVNDLKIPLQASVEGFTRLAGATRNSALEGKQTKDLFQGLSEASTVLSLSAEDTSGTLEALSKAMSQGRVGAELFDELGVRIPGVLGIASRAMGTTEEEFNRLKEAGRITPEDFFPKFGRQLHNEFGEAAKGASDNAPSAVFGVQNSFLKLQQSIGEGVAPAAIPGLNALSAILEAIASHAKELGFILFSVSATLSIKMVGALQSVIATLIETRLATGTLSGGMASLGQSINNSFSAKLSVGIFAVLEVVNLLNQAVNTELTQSFDQAAESAKRAAEETKKAFEKPKPEASGAVERFLDKYAIAPFNSATGSKISTFAEQENAEIERGKTQGLDPVATSGPGQFGDMLINLYNKGIGSIPGAKLTTWGEYERDKVNNDIQEQGLSNVDNLGDARLLLSQFKTGTGEAGKLRPIDAQLKTAEEERAILKAQIKRDFTDKGQTPPAKFKQQLEASNLKIAGLNDQRSEASKPLTLLLSRTDREISSIKTQIEDLNKPENIKNLGGDAAADKQRENLLKQLAPKKELKANLEEAIGSLRIDPIRAFTNALRQLNLVFAESQEKTQLAFDTSKAEISTQQVAGFKSNKFAGKMAAVNLALKEKEKARLDYEHQQTISKGLDTEVNQPTFQTTLQRLGVTPDSSAAEIDDRLKNTTDESDKGILEKLKTSREQKNKLSGMRDNYAQSMQKVQSTVQDFHSFQIDEKAADSSAVIQKNENLQTASIKRSLEAKVIVEEVANEQIAKIQLKTTQDQRKNLNEQLSEVRASHEAGFMSAEEFAKKERDLTTQQTALEKQEAENRLAVQSATLARRLKEIEFFNKKAEALTGTKQADSTRIAKEKLLKAGLTPQAQDQFSLDQTKIDGVKASDDVVQVKDRIAQNEELYKTGKRDARDFMLERYALNQELAKANLAVVEQEINAEEKYRDSVEHNIQRIMQAEENRFRKQQSQLDESKSKLDLYNQSLEQTKKLEESRRNLSKALSDAAIAPLENKKNDADDAEALVEKLRDPKIKPQEKAAVKAQLQKLGYGQQYGLTVTPATVTKGSSGDDPDDYELQIKESKATIEQKIASLKEDSMKKEQEFQRKSLENDLKRQKIAAQIALYDAQAAQYAAQKAKNEAEGALKIAISKKDPVAIETAQTNLDIANKQIDLSNQRVESAQANLNDQPEIAANATQEQKVRAGTETQNFQAGEDRRKRGTALDLVEAGEKAGKPMSLWEAEAKTGSTNPQMALPQKIELNPMPKLDLKPGENIFDAYQRQRDEMKLPNQKAVLPKTGKADIPPQDKTTLAINSSSIQPRESAGGNQFVEALKMANQGIEQRLDALSSAIITLANTPRSLTVSTANPVDDTAKIMNNFSRGQVLGAGM
ncbi:MAG: tape measure protein [Nostoc sp.]|uniref:tape measure protein n=1 Tax=Nostoc sp. TaxID=1180 RepID=UPI002FF51ED2